MFGTLSGLNLEVKKHSLTRRSSGEETVSSMTSTTDFKMILRDIILQYYVGVKKC